MYSKQEASILREKFWTNFGQYLSPIPGTSGNAINWVNYKTGVKNIQFKMDVNNEHAYIGIEITHADLKVQETFFGHFKSLLPELETTLEERWIWEPGMIINGKKVSRIGITLENVSVFNQADWPQIISFLKPRILALDKFWTNNKEIIEMLDQHRQF